MRVLVAARISRGVKAEEKSRIEADDDRARVWAEAEGHTVVVTSADRNVSGSVSPWKRPELGKWLTDPAFMEQYDMIVSSSIDRLGRSAADLFALREWATEHGKIIVIRTPNLVWPPSPDDIGSPIVWDVIGRVGEIELNLIKKRSADTRAVITDTGGAIGKVPWAFCIEGSRYEKTIRPVPSLVGHLLGMVWHAMQGESLRNMALWLDAEGVPTRTGTGPWSAVSVRQILQSECLKGVHRNGSHRMAVTPALLSKSEWTALQKAIDRGHRGPASSDLVMVGPDNIRCGECGGPMYRNMSGPLAFYRCKGSEHSPSICKNGVRSDLLDSWVDLWFTSTPVDDGGQKTEFLGPFGHHEVIEQLFTAGDDHQAEIADLADEMRALDPLSDDYLGAVTELKRLLEAVQSAPVTPGQMIERPTGQTVAEMWQSLDLQGRRNYLSASGVQVVVSKLGANQAGGIDGRHSVILSGDPTRVIGTVRVAA